jgi:peptidoglycan/xylan/chitin deacetylase (PgdA/CDA1 family)
MSKVWRGKIHKMRAQIAFTTSIQVLTLIIVLFSFITVSFSQETPNQDPIVTIAFDDGRISQYKYAFPLMEERGITGTFYVIPNMLRDNSGNSEFMSYQELIELQNAGNEIGSHSLSHLAFTTLSEEKIRYQCQKSKEELENYGLNIQNFAYPYEDNNDYVDSIVKDYYVSARDAYTSTYIMSLPTSQFCLYAFAGETGTSNALPRLKNVVDQITDGDWLIVFFHNIKPNLTNENYAISTQDFEAFLDYLVAKKVAIKTINNVLANAESIPEPAPEPEESSLLQGDFRFYKTAGMIAYGEQVDSYKITVTYNPSASQRESALWYQTIKGGVAGETYRFRVKYKSNVESTILFLIYSTSNSQRAVSLNLGASNDWKQSIWLTATMPSNLNYFRIDCRLFNRNSGWAIFDDIELVSTTLNNN